MFVNYQTTYGFIIDSPERGNKRNVFIEFIQKIYESATLLLKGEVLPLRPA